MKTLSSTVDSQKSSLTPEEFIVFLKLTVEDPDGGPLVLNLTDGGSRNWRSEFWTNSPFQLSGINHKSSGELSRPRLTLPNLNSAFSYYIGKKLLENAEVLRYRVLPSELDDGTFEKNTYYIRQITSLQSQLITFQLRTPSDGNNARLPLRRFVQPEFPTVVL